MLTTAQNDIRERLIVALDVPTVEAARKIVADLGSDAIFYKIGFQLALAGGIDLGKANAGHAFDHDLDATGFPAFEVDDFDQGADAMEGIGGAFLAAGSLHGEDQFLIGGQRFLDCEDRARLADEQGDDVARKDHHFLHRKQWQPLTKEIEAAHRVLR